MLPGALAAAVQGELDGQEAACPASGAVVSVRAAAGAWTAGFARASAAAPRVRPGDRVLLYSFTKTIVAAALLRLVAAGRLALDGTLEAWLPEIAVAPRITLRQVLLHAAGLPDYGGLSAYHEAVRSGAAPWTEEEFLQRTGAEALLFEPGTGWAYSNIGYMLLRRVLVRATGSGGMETVLRREMFDPLGAATASVPTAKADLAGFAFGPSVYLGGDGPPVAVPNHYDPGWIATGVVGASAADAALILDGILGGLLPPGLRTEMTDPAARFDKTWPGRPWLAPAYGLGLMIERSQACGPACGHTGSGPGGRVAAYRFPRGGADPITVTVVIDGEDEGLAERIAFPVAEGTA